VAIAAYNGGNGHYDDADMPLYGSLCASMLPLPSMIRPSKQSIHSESPNCMHTVTFNQLQSEIDYTVLWGAGFTEQPHDSGTVDTVSATPQLHQSLESKESGLEPV
jgi:hypothetical protein